MKIFLLGISVFCILFSSCSKHKKTSSSSESQKLPPYCASVKTPYNVIAPSTGAGTIFDLNPKNASNDPNLLPTSSAVSSFTMPVTLEHLNGYGTLNGTFIDVRSGVCKGNAIGAFSESNQFNYTHDDYRFSEVMAYYYGDQYRLGLSNANVLLPKDPVVILSNCPIEDNAFFTRDLNDDGTFFNIVCLGRSSYFSSNHSTFADDAEVITHELQHSQTTYAYSPRLALGSLRFDEAGAINEGISDAIALIHALPSVKSNFDIKKFSFWALGSLFGTDGDYSRGVRRCPTYDASYPNCLNYKNDASGFSLDHNTVSFNYPDGMGFPYTGFYPNVRKAFTDSLSHQEIHQTSLISSGIIFEIFEVFQKERGYESAKNLISQVVSRALQFLPKPNNTISIAPVNHINFFKELLAASVALNVSASELSEIKQIGIDRGVYQYNPLGNNWSRYAGFRFMETQGSARYDGELNRGDIGYLSLNFENLDHQTAGGVLVDFKILDEQSPVEILGPDYNDGFLSKSEAMVQYGKINGTSIVEALNGLPLSNDYFGTYTNAKNNRTYQSTAFAIVVKSGSNPGLVRMSARLVPSNGPEETVYFNIEVKP